MRGFPQELIFVLVFGAVLLIQFLMKQLRRKAVLMQQEAEATAETTAEASAPETSLPAPVVRTPVFAGLNAALQAPRAARTSPPLRPRLRRFSRQALMPDRRAVQDAVVIAAILRPCHAHRPHGVD